eukprot:3573189-Karenia_brevis.AAC.1
MLGELIDALARIGLTLSQKPGKSAFLRLAGGTDIERPLGQFMIGTQTYKQVHSMVFVGCTIHESGDPFAEVEYKYDKAVRAFYAAKNRLVDKSTSILARLKLLRTLVGNVFLYGMETMALPDHVCKRLDALYNRFVGQMMNIHRPAECITDDMFFSHRSRQISDALN